MRTRSRNIGTMAGTYIYAGSTQDRSSPMQFESCTDEDTKPGDDHDFSHSKRDIVIGHIDGPCAGGVYNSWPLTDLTLTSHSSTNPSLSGYVTDVLGNTNPASSNLSIPQMLFELPESIEMLRHTGSALWRAEMKDVNRLRKPSPRALGNIYLEYSFGWKPLISDVCKVLDLTRLIKIRASQIIALLETGSSSASCVLVGDNVDNRDFSRSYLHSTNATWISAVRQDTTHTRIWGSARWKASGNLNYLLLPLMGDKSTKIQRLANMLAVGGDLSQVPSNLWEALPWSWLIDYFIHFGSFIRAVNNRIARPSGKVCIMCRRTTTREYTDLIKPVGLTVSDLRGVYETKTRSVYDPVPTVSFSSFLTGRQLSIIGALAAQRS